jgi:hypothetical protein
MMVNYSEWHTERAPQGNKVNSVEETSSLSDKIDTIMAMLANDRTHVDPNNVLLASLVAQEEHVDVNFIRNNNFNNNAYRNNFASNNYMPYPSTNGNGYRWISCRKNTGYHATDPRIRTQGAERVRSWIATKHGDGSLECQMRYALQRETPSFTQVQGPHGEVKPLLPAFLYYNATPREEYKVLVTKL